MKVTPRFVIFMSLCVSALCTYAQNDAQPIADSPTYQLIGSYHDGDNFSEDLVDNQYTFPSERVGSVFFKIKDKNQNIYFGGVLQGDDSDSANKNYTPLAGSYVAFSSDRPEGVGSLYFTMSEGYQYTILFQEPSDNAGDSNYIISLKIERIKDGNFDILAQSNGTLTQGMFWPVLLPEALNDEALKEATITSVSVSSWDYPFLSERFNRVFYWSCPDGQEYHLSDWDEIIGQGDIVDDQNGAAAAQNWFVDPTVYADDAYCYQLVVVMNVDGKSRRFVANSERFFINASGDPLVIRAYYLVQRGEGTGEYYTLPSESNSNVYDVTNLNGSLGKSGNIIFTKANLNDEQIDFGDENTFRFTDQILVRSNKPYGIESHMIKKFTLYNVTDPSNPVLIVDSESNGNTYNNDEGRFMAIAECQINTQDYRLVMDYVDAEGNEQSLQADVSIAVTIPSPKIQESYVEYFKGSDTTEATDNSTFKFSYPALSPISPFNLTGARYHNLRQFVKLIKPNTTDALGVKMLDTSSGSFKYFYECYKDGEVVGTVNLRFQSNSEEHTVVWDTNGPNVIPEDLLMPEQQGNYDSRRLAYTHTFPTEVYDRWGDGTLAQIEVTDEPPVCEVPAKVTGCQLYYRPNANNSNLYDLVEDFKVHIVLDDEAAPNKVIYNDGTEGQLLHKTGNDYYYVVIVDTKAEGIELDGPTKPEYIASTGNRSYPETVVSGDALKKGVDIAFSHVHTRKTKMVWDEEVENAYNNPFCNQLQLRISYLYPFRTYGSADNAPAMQKISAANWSVPSNLRGNVIMSKPLVYGLETEFVTTGVDDIAADSGATVTVGKGYVMINGGGEGAVYALDGRLMGKGSGFIAVPNGIYVVSTNNEKIKVVVP